jgi:DNA ligase-1
MATPLAALADLAAELSGTTSRLAKRDLVARFLRRLAPDEVSWAVAFLAGRPFPASDPRVLDVAWRTLGEIGVPAGPTADAHEPKAAGPGLDLLAVASSFEAIAAARGTGSRRRKLEILRGLFALASPSEQGLISSIVHGEMRLGFQEGLLPDAIALASGVPVALVRRALLFVSDPAVVAALALRDGEAGVSAVSLRLFVPLLPMLAEPVADLEAALRLHGGRSALEYKYDGARVQIHKRGDEVRIWSRRLTEVTGSLPEIVALARSLPAAEAILDGEVVATGADGRPLPFQELMRRFRRVHEIEASAGTVPLALHLFDCLFLDGEPLVDRHYEARWAALVGLTHGRALARRLVVDDAPAALAFQRDALAAGHEGLVAKALDGSYTPGTRGSRWLKVKTAETVDCVIVAADRGSGRRRGWLSNYHLAVVDPSGGLAPVGKTFKGLTDDEFRAMTARLQAIATGDDGYTVTVRPEVVVEVAYNEIQRSPQYASGVALRFARIVRIRDDKGAPDATTLPALHALYERQFAAKGRAPDGAGPRPGRRVPREDGV